MTVVSVRARLMMQKSNVMPIKNNQIKAEILVTNKTA